MNSLMIFENSQIGKVRVKNLNSNIFFCLKDVCEILDIKNISDCKKRLKLDGVVSSEVGVTTGKRKDGSLIHQNILMNFINESNFYKVIFQSRKKEALLFSDWVTEKVLPSIRKTGKYDLNEDNRNELLAKAYLLAENRIKNIEIEKAQMQVLIDSNKTKVEFADKFKISNNSILIREFAKLLNQNGFDIGEKRLFQYLRDNKYLISSKYSSDYNLPTQKSADLKLFEIKESIYQAYNENRISRSPLLTTKGQTYFLNKLSKEREEI